MGIRFRCPNGHKLNVKSFLAGKKAFCPVCGTKLVVPLASASEPGAGRRKADPDRAVPKPTVIPGVAPASPQPLPPAPMAVPAVPVAAPAAPMGMPVPMTEPMVAVVPAAPALAARVVEPVPASSPPGFTPGGPPDPLAEAPDAVWYVRPPSGGQYGPATATIMRGWIHEGRLSADSLVWREGWRDWQDAGKVFPQLHQGGDLVGLPKAIPPGVPGLPGAPVVAGVPAARVIAPRRRSSTAQAIIIVLLVLAVFVLAGIFTWVLLQQPAEPPANEPAAKPKAVAAFRGESETQRAGVS